MRRGGRRRGWVDAPLLTARFREEEEEEEEDIQ